MLAFLGNPEGDSRADDIYRHASGAGGSVHAHNASHGCVEAVVVNIAGSGWLPEKDVAEAGQYDLLRLGFQPLEENSGGDMVSSPYEKWMPEAFDSISQATAQGDEWYEQVPPFYRELMVKMAATKMEKWRTKEKQLH